MRRHFESLEARLMLHGGHDHGLDDTHDPSVPAITSTPGEGESNGKNGPHASDPNYNPAQAFHIHAGLTIYVKGEKVTVPIFSTTTNAIHTHDATGAIHIHPPSALSNFVTLKDVFDAWRTATSGANANAVLTSTNLMGNIVDTQNSLQMFVNGVRTTDFENYQIHDKDQILLVYGSNPIITLNTNFGPIPVELFETKTPATVNNFLNYVNGGDYNNSFFHRFVSGFVLQGGGFTSTSPTYTSTSQFTNIPTDPAVVNEFDNWAIASGSGATVTQNSSVIQLPASAVLTGVKAGDRIRLTGRTDGISNTNMFEITAVDNNAHTVTVSPAPTAATGTNVTWRIFPPVNVHNTLAMAKVGGDPNSATSQFFFNLGNNDDNLDLQNGGFTVFARIFDVAQGEVTDSSTPANQLLNGSYTQWVSSLTRTTAGGTFNELPLGANSQLVMLQSISGEGEVKGFVYNDTDLNGTKGSSETGRQGVVVYADANNNNQLDSGEISTTTDSTGAYTLRLAPGQHRIKMVAVDGSTQSSPSGGYTTTVEIGRDVTARDFGLLSLVAPTGIDLVANSDTGQSSTDNITRLNNANSSSTLQFQVTGVVAGATVEVLADGAVIGQAVVPSGGNGTITITTNGTTTITDGTHTITARQKLNDATATLSTGLTVQVDSTAPTFTSNAPFTANIGVPFNYDAQTNEDSSGNVSFAIQNAPTGATINGTTGVVSWTPTADQMGSRQFNITATDVAGNVSTQAVVLNVTKPPQVRVRLAVTDLNGNPITAINVGDIFQLQAFVQDVRSNPTGVKSIYEDVTWTSNIASVVAGTIVRGPNYNSTTSGTAGNGLLDEIGATSASTSNLGGSEQLVYKVNLRADSAGLLSFIGNAPDVLPANNITLFGSSTPVPLDEIDFGQTVAIQVHQVAPSSLSGVVYIDTDNDGVKDSNEQPLSNVTVTLTGTDSFGTAVSRTATTGTDGTYAFNDLNPGDYKIVETQPTFQINGLPVLDGKDTIGSLGGTVSANDEFTITLAEGANGTNYNFGELVGRSLGGVLKAFGTNGSSEAGLVMAGAQLQLFTANGSAQPTGNPIQTTTVEPDGTFTFNGLAAGTYVVQMATPAFLQGGLQQQVLQLDAASDSLDNVLVQSGLQPRFISFRDFMNSTPRHGLFAAVTTGTNSNLWDAFDASWNGFRDVNVTLTSDTNRLRIEAINTSGEVLFDEVQVSDSRVRTIAQEGTQRLYRIAGGSSQFNLRPVSSTTQSSGSGEGEGEGESVLSAAMFQTNTSSASSTAPANSSAEGESVAEGEGAGDLFTRAGNFAYANFSSTNNGLTSSDSPVIVVAPEYKPLPANLQELTNPADDSVFWVEPSDSLSNDYDSGLLASSSQSNERSEAVDNYFAEHSDETMVDEAVEELAATQGDSSSVEELLSAVFDDELLV